MPVVLRIRGYRFWFYEADLVEPPHVHVGRENNEAKFWLNSLSLVRSRGFKEHELNEIEKILKEHKEDIITAWQKEKEKHGNR
ncbi:MAG: DUF4160 domain-containing protein [Ignavibacteriae bacterium]|nr:DUF4160 domain-containing protein [Ignavibacteriota bacterium]